MKALILDLSTENILKVLEINRLKNRTGIISGMVFPYENLEKTLEEFHVKRVREKMTDHPVTLILPDRLVRGITFEFPPMPARELETVLLREINALSNLKEPVVFDYRKGHPSGRDGEQETVTAFYCATGKIKGLLHDLGEAKVKPERITCSQAAFFALPPEDEEGKGAWAYMDISGNRVKLNISTRSRWVYQREFLFSRQESLEMTPEHLERISTEINRTFQFFKQKQRDLTIRRLLVMGTHPGLSPVQSALAARFEMSVDFLEADIFPNDLVIPSHLLEDKEFTRVFGLSPGVAALLNSSREMDLFPPELKEKAALPRRLTGLFISASILGIIMLAGWVNFERIKGSYRSQIKEQAAFFSSVNQREADRMRRFIPRLPPSQGSRARRELGQINRPLQLMETMGGIRRDFYQQEYYIHYPELVSYTMARFLTEISRIKSPGIRIDFIGMEPGEQRIQAEINGDIRRGEDLLSEFLSFYRQLKAFPNVLDIQFSKVRVNLENPHRQQSRQGDSEKTEQLYFSIHAVLELE